MEKGKYKVVGLSKGNRFTFDNDGDVWWATSAMPDDRFAALFNWAKGDKGFWQQNIMATVEYDRLSTDGIPINGKVLSIEIEL